MSKEFLDKPPRTKSAEQALESLMALCARAERSSGDAKRLMYRWGVPIADRAAVLERLVYERFIDDNRYASAFVRDKLRFSGWGAYKIRVALAAKGVAKSIIDHVLEELEPATMQNRLDESLAKKSRTIKAANDYDRRAKLIRYGLSLGYDYDSVMDAVQKLPNVCEEF